MAGRRTTAAAAALGAYAVASGVAGAVLGLDHEHAAPVGVVVVTTTAVTATAVLLLDRLPRHAVTHLVTVVAAGHLTGLWSGALGERLGAGHPAASRLGDLVFLATVPVLSVLLTVFPSGRPATARWRPVYRAQLGALAVLAGLVLLRTGTAVERALSVAAGVVLVVCAVAALGSLALRWRAADPEDRAGMRAFAVVAVVLVGCYVVGGLGLVGLGGAGWPVGDAVFAGLVGGLPAAVGYGVLRHRLYAIDVVVRRAAAWSLVTLVLLAVYVAAVTAVTSVTGGPSGVSTASVVAALVAAVLLAPLRRSAQSVADRLFYGRRGDPARLHRELAEQLVAGVAAGDVPQRLAGVVAEHLRLPHVAVEIDREGRWDTVATAGPGSDASVEVLPVSIAGEVPARLVVAPRRGEPQVSARDRQVLQDAVTQAAPALLSARLVDELERSRERLVAATTDERNRLRHDLHDTLSPSLNGIRLAADAAARQIGDSSPPAALLSSIAAEAARTGAAVRRMLDRLAPVDVEEHDVVSAVRARVRQVAAGSGMAVDVVTASDLPPLAPHVVEAAYRICVEAVSNAARHSGGSACRVLLSADDALVLDVHDDGTGLSPTAAAGVGLESMVSRAREVGGDCRITAEPTGGTRVLARLPLQREGAA